MTAVHLAYRSAYKEEDRATLKRSIPRDELARAVYDAAVYLRGQHAASKSIRDVVQGYLDDITVNFERQLDGEILESESVRRHKAYLKRDAEPAYIEGLKEGGIDEPELDEEDRATIAEWIDGQREHVPGLWAEVQAIIDDYTDGRNDRKQFEVRRRAMYERLGLWGDTLRELANKGKASALQNMMVTWHLGATEKHCKICARLDGKRQRLKWFTSRGYIPQEKASETLDCGGWECQCTLEDDKGKQVLP